MVVWVSSTTALVLEQKREWRLRSCEIAYGPKTIFHSIVVVPKDPITKNQIKYPGERMPTSTTISTLKASTAARTVAAVKTTLKPDQKTTEAKSKEKGSMEKEEVTENGADGVLKTGFLAAFVINRASHWASNLQWEF
ncbi:hypothetical protein L596_025699 [Steinernema carpocapsae]|uniref:Uncharacterized protein n=1 Tax=Steinernema carpocapsae TaxID=34508 RepID=A0A4U5M8R4_STECR|nr:hypothetical protein L596_025699 [Steinernema carpocapsae]